MVIGKSVNVVLSSLVDSDVSNSFDVEVEIITVVVDSVWGSKLEVCTPKVVELSAVLDSSVETKVSCWVVVLSVTVVVVEAIGVVVVVDELGFVSSVLLVSSVILLEKLVLNKLLSPEVVCSAFSFSVLVAASFCDVVSVGSVLAVVKLDVSSVSGAEVISKVVVSTTLAGLVISSGLFVETRVVISLKSAKVEVVSNVTSALVDSKLVFSVFSLVVIVVVLDS